jgi:hypothetical protein
MKFSSSLLLLTAFITLSIAGFLAWMEIDPYSPRREATLSPDAQINSNSSSRPRSSPNIGSAGEGDRLGQALSLPDGAVVEDGPEREQQSIRELLCDDSILAMGSVRENTLSVSNSEEKASRQKRLESINSKDWQGQPNLLVNEIRAARGFQIPLTVVEDFLAGRDMRGWNDGQRNWIGDELMIMLRQEVPQEAYRIFQSLLADPSAPDAMRDYSVQHISHLIAARQVGKEGVAVIRAALDSGDPIYASTALVSLHRLSTTQPQWISPEQVAELASQHQHRTDLRMQRSAKAIRQEWDAR